MPLKRLIYTSRIAPNLLLSDFFHIMDHAKAENQKRGISGLLIFSTRFFAQWLEGETSAIDRLYDSIAKDVRHSAVTVREQCPIIQNRWSAWGMNLGLLVHVDGLSESGDPSQMVDFEEEAKDLVKLRQRFFLAALQLQLTPPEPTPKWQ